MGDVQQLKAAILALSRATDWEVAKTKVSGPSHSNLWVVDAADRVLFPPKRT